MQDNEVDKEANDEVDNENIDTVTNGILNIIFYLVTLILMPLTFCNKNTTTYSAVIFLILMLAIIFTRKIVEKFKNVSQRQKCADFFNRFEKDFYRCGYMIAALEFIVFLSDGFSFWFVCSALGVFFIIIFIGNIRSSTKNNKVNSIPSDVYSNEKYKENNANKRIFYNIKLKEMLHRKKYKRKVKIEYSYEKKLQKHNSYNKDKED